MAVQTLGELTGLLVFVGGCATGLLVTRIREAMHRIRYDQGGLPRTRQIRVEGTVIRRTGVRVFLRVMPCRGVRSAKARTTQSHIG
jgi:hypothetical protein